MRTMKKKIVLGIIAVFALHSSATAETNVKINNNVNTSSNNSSTGTSHSRVEVTTNGETKIFESTGEDIDYQSPDGNTTVQINSNGQTLQQNAQEKADSVTKDVRGAVDDAKKEVEQNIQVNQDEVEKKVADEVKKQKENIIEQIVSFFKNIFNL